MPVPLTNRRGDPRGGQDRIYSTPGREGDLWIAAYDGLYHSPLPVRDLIFVRWTKSVLSMPSVLARQSRAVTIRPFI